MTENKSVQLLLQAENKANEIIEKAHQDRIAKLKEARLAAETEIALFKKEQEEKFQQTIKEKYSSNEDDSDLGAVTKQEIDEIYKAYDKRKEEVANLLIDRIMNVELEIPNVIKRSLAISQGKH
eukprot:CAMPEP_0176475068 /NCGR_PEP_ID=MMETSP0127-20121128/43395_1 /TAXON_ID=938130 /ORGANISM="Platyophrya macrostoma, Strain WH" /LENGTH=123 /DNA_ID=CAMNT_0017870611 /DNA_START=35 /DNA_END=406 /DNA_ORIENTATION=-